MRARLAPVALPLVLASCLGPLTSDRAGYSEFVLPASSVPPDIATDRELSQRIAGADGASSNPVERRNGSAAGASVSYWDLGAGSRFVSSLYRLVHCDADGGVLASPDGDVDHPPIVTSAPGDPAYSPFLREWVVCVTDAYRGEVIPSMRALSDARALGLVGDPIPTSVYRHLPIFAPDVVFDLGDASPPVSPSVALYYAGYVAHAMPMGGDAGSRYGASITKAGRVYRLRNSATPPVSEVVFSVARGTSAMPNASYSPLFRIVNVTMSNAYVPSSATKEADLFTVSGATLTPVHPNITSFELTDQYVDDEIQLAPEVP